MGNCAHCGKELTGTQRKFCSKSCNNKTRAPNYGTSTYRPVLHEQSTHCTVCGKFLTGRQVIYCSRRCKMIGEENSYPAQKKRGQTRKLNLIERAGGKCAICGYAKNLAALTFHHKEEKAFGLDRARLGRHTVDEIEAEFQKCELLCANCHQEHHNPMLRMDLLARTNFDDYSHHEPENQREGHCIICDRELTGKQQRYCSITCQNAYHQNYDRQQQRGIARKLELVRRLGGQCTVCGYKENLAVLNFHHLDDKAYPLDLRSFSNRSLDALLAEFEKCQLLCANCHTELHHPELDFTGLSTTRSM